LTTAAPEAEHEAMASSSPTAGRYRDTRARSAALGPPPSLVAPWAGDRIDVARRDQLADRRADLPVDLRLGDQLTQELLALRVATRSDPYLFGPPRRLPATPAILGPDGQPLADGSPERHRLDLAITEITDDLIARFAADPALMYDMPPLRFEELITELYQRHGFDAKLTRASKDRGVDIYVARHDRLGRSLSIVQCKRYAAHRKIGVNLVRELQGAQVGSGANAAVLITTSTFTQDARDLEREFHWDLSLQDYQALIALLRDAPPSPRTALL
jgi:hypothetical protein